MPKRFQVMSLEQRLKIAAAHKARGIGGTPTKRCPLCQETKDRLVEFGVRKNGFSRSRCRKCEDKKTKEWMKANPEKMRAINARITLFRLHGLTPKHYEKLSAAQNGMCAICSVCPDPGKRLYIDHCHKTNRIRGLLCNRCNRAMGLFEDDPELLRKVIDYLLNNTTDLASVPGLPSGFKKPRRRLGGER